MLLLVHQEVSDPPADMIRRVHLRQLVLEEIWEEGVDGVGTACLHM